MINLDYDFILNHLSGKPGFEGIPEALKHATPQEIVERGIRYAVKTLPKYASQVDDCDAASLKRLTVKGTARKRIMMAIKALIEYNESHKDKWCITKGSVFKVCGSNRVTIAELMDNDAEIKAIVSFHNESHKLTPEHNNKKRKGTFPSLSV
jgi:hypothetical protein